MQNVNVLFSRTTLKVFLPARKSIILRESLPKARKVDSKQPT